MQSIHPAAGTLPHPAATPAPIDLEAYVREMFATVRFASLEQALRYVRTAVERVAGRRLSYAEDVRTGIVVTGRWVLGRLEADAYEEDAQRSRALTGGLAS